MACCVEHCKKPTEEVYYLGDVLFEYCKRHACIPENIKQKTKSWRRT